MWTITSYTISYVAYLFSLSLSRSLPLLKYFQNAAGHDGFMSRPYFGKHRWWAALSSPLCDIVKVPHKKWENQVTATIELG